MTQGLLSHRLSLPITRLLRLFVFLCLCGAVLASSLPLTAYAETGKEVFGYHTTGSYQFSDFYSGAGNQAYCASEERDGPQGVTFTTWYYLGSAPKSETIADPHSLAWLMAHAYPLDKTLNGKNPSSPMRTTQAAVWMLQGTMNASGVSQRGRDCVATGEISTSDVAIAAALVKEAQSHAGESGPWDTQAKIWISPSGALQNMIEVLPIQYGSISIVKTSALPSVTDSQPAYSLVGARFGLYSDKDCTKLIKELTTNEKGVASVSNLVVGTYYLKEIEAPSGFELSSEVLNVSVKANTTAKVEVSNLPKGITSAHLLQKLAEDDGKYGLQKTRFKVEYFPAFEKSPSENPVRTWEFEADKAGYVLYDAEHLVGGDELFVDTTGVPFLPLGTYAVTETKASSGYRLSDSSTHYAQIVLEDDGGTVWQKLENWTEKETDEAFAGRGIYNEAAPRIKTSLTYEKSHYAPCVGTIQLIDTVSYEYLVVGKAYRVEGALYDKESGEALLDPAGKPVVSEVEFLADKRTGSAEVVFEISADLAAGKTLVCFEELFEEGSSIAVHADLNDAQQSVFVPSIKTELTDKAGNHEIAQAEEIELIDTVRYINLEAGKEYNLSGTLTDKQTGEPLLNEQGEILRAQSSFTPSESSGVATVSFTVPYSLVAGKHIVAFEILTREEQTIAIHADLEDQDQSITIPSIKTRAHDKSDGDDHASTLDDVVIVDTISYEGLTPGTTYVVEGSLIQKSTQKALGIDVSQEFIPEEAAGSIELEFVVSAQTLADEHAVVFEKLLSGERLMAFHEDLEDDAQTVAFPGIQTSLANQDSQKLVCALPATTLIDTVSYRGLKLGKTYTLTGTLMDKATEKPLVSDKGEMVLSTLEFTPETADGEVSLTFEVPGELIAGHTLVAFETLSSQDIVVAVHADINDEAQTVIVPKIGTALTGKEGEKVLEASSEPYTLTDTIGYEGLIAGQTYTVYGALMDKSTGEAALVDGKTITATKEFVASDSGQGSVAISFSITPTSLSGLSLVAFETVEYEGHPVAIHADINSEEQTVSIKNPTLNRLPRTGDYGKTGIAACAVVGVLALGGAYVSRHMQAKSVRKRRR